VQGRLASQRTKMDKLGRRAKITVQAYQTYPPIEGCRLHVPSRERSYFFVTFHVIRQDIHEPTWQDKYITASVRSHGDTLEDDSCPPINFYAAELFAGQFASVAESPQTSTLCTMEYPNSIEFTYADMFKKMASGRQPVA
jgi:hypothetical protein